MNVATRIEPLEIPVMRAPPLIGVLPELQRDPLGLMLRASECGPIVRMPMPTVEAYLLSHPRLAEHVLVTNSRNYVKQTRGYEMLRKVLGNGLVTSEGTFWKRQRRISQPAFHRERLAGFADAMVRAATEMVAGWREGQEVDLSHEYMRCTLRVIGETMLSTDVTGEADEVGAALTVALEHLIHRTTHLFAPPEWVPTARNRTFNKALERLDAAVMGIIEQRRASGSRPDLLSMLMDMVDSETGERMDDQQLRDEVMTVFLAGHETTANALSWTSALLGQDTTTMARLVEEVDGALGQRPVTMQDLAKLPLNALALKESMRLYPPIWALGRAVVEDELVEGVWLKKGSLVFVSPWVLHRLPEFWPEPERFDLGRWSVEDPRRAHGAYLPFSMGQRKCIGDGFAMVEAQIILATVLQRVRVTLVPGQRFEPEPVITLRPRYGVRAIVTGRGAPLRGRVV